ncbi:MAG TPA: 30S ribosomal protein S16 [Acidimicrobiia bacterium]|nr:30S ribosomal protein S16 [Acidimicrobiia bacterium]
MAVKIRLTRLGKKKQPTYRVVVMDSRKARDGQYIEQLGFYDPRQEPSLIQIDNERALHWLTTGAQPTERAKKLLEISGAWTQFKIAKGEIHTVGDDEPKAKSPKPKAPNVKTPAEVTSEVVVEQDEEPAAASETPEDEISVPDVVAAEAEVVEPDASEPITAEAPDRTDAS